ncbi:hypothetical protein SNEBB_002359 [Seison nebaliae]|nr:hypothetical protein SNEBB_002359 [Seison nebaliae]
MVSQKRRLLRNSCSNNKKKSRIDLESIAEVIVRECINKAINSFMIVDSVDDTDMSNSNQTTTTTTTTTTTSNKIDNISDNDIIPISTDDKMLIDNDINDKEFKDDDNDEVLCETTDIFRDRSDHIFLSRYERENNSSRLIAQPIIGPIGEDIEYVTLPHYNEENWRELLQLLSKPITSTKDFQHIILRDRKIPRHFDGLHSVLNEEFPKPLKKIFFNQVFPGIVNLVIDTPKLFPKRIPCLNGGRTMALTLSQRQCACLLANAFVGTFEGAKHRMLSFNFVNFFSRRNEEKLKCILNYFKRIMDDMPEGLVTFRRRSLRRFLHWNELNNRLDLKRCKVQIFDKGTIEDDDDCLQVDFANKYIGGGVLNHGCVQEEIRFVLCPEMIVAKLFTQKLEDNDCLVMIGCERFSNYVGYARTFEFSGNHEDKTQRDSFGRIKCRVVAIDATRFIRSPTQYSERFILRDLNKCFIGFMRDRTDELSLQNVQAVATGNWGCGAFNGDVYLKILLQWLALLMIRRDMNYYTFGHKDVKRKFEEFLTQLQTLTEKYTIKMGQLFRIVCDYHQTNSKVELYDFILQSLEDLYKEK